jgi:hypothetical protein
VSIDGEERAPCGFETVFYAGSWILSSEDPFLVGNSVKKAGGLAVVGKMLLGYCTEISA